MVGMYRSKQWWQLVYKHENGRRYRYERNWARAFQWMIDKNGGSMKQACAYYVEHQDKHEKKILVFLDEPATDLPEGAILIVETTDPTELSNTLEPYWLMIQR